MSKRPGKFLVKPIDKKAKSDFRVAPADMADAGPGDLVRIEALPTRGRRLREAKVVEKLDRLNGTKSISLIAMRESGIPIRFSDEAFEEARRAKAPTLDHRDDIRHIPLITIDGGDARDFDDAVHAEADEDPRNASGFRLLVAIADVSWYVRPGTALDREAYMRGNSTYFPDRVVPMLPEPLSNGWCSLSPREDRGCLAAELVIDGSGNPIAHRIFRGLMRSHARLTYDQVQAHRDGAPEEATDGLDGVIAPLFAAYECLAENRRKRGVMELDLPERRVSFAEDGDIAAMVPRQRRESHKMIEEFMILANVAAAETLEARKRPCMYRVHAEPPRDKVAALREFLSTLDIPFAKGQAPRPRHFARVLEQARNTPRGHMVSQVTLRTQSQAVYSPDNIGHFGLALHRYCHFTSPIRRYSDLLVHRALVAGLGLGPGRLETDHKDFAEMGEHVSRTERRSAVAERNAMDRFAAKFLSGRGRRNFRGSDHRRHPFRPLHRVGRLRRGRLGADRKPAGRPLRPYRENPRTRRAKPGTDLSPGRRRRRPLDGGRSVDRIDDFEFGGKRRRIVRNEATETRASQKNTRKTRGEDGSPSNLEIAKPALGTAKRAIGRSDNDEPGNFLQNCRMMAWNFLKKRSAR